MSNCIMVGCDLHKKTLVLRYSVDLGAVQGQDFVNNLAGRQSMVKWLQKWREEISAERVLFAYEASSQGFGLYDELRAMGIECHVLAPTNIARSLKQIRGKNDGRDALHILELLRAHVLAGNSLPSVWVPDPATRDDRELVRLRLTLATKFGVIKNQIQSLLKRYELRRPSITGKAWTKLYLAWLKALATHEEEGLRAGGRAALSSLLRQMEALEKEIKVVDKQLLELSECERYQANVAALLTIKGVGVLTAMVFLSELGDLRRFSNRRQLAAYLGLTPTSNESGEHSDRKGHITRQGPSRVRKVLNQATWSLIRTNPRFRQKYDAIARRNPKHRKIAVVGMMRQLGIIMWHRAIDGGPPPEKQENKAGPARRAAGARRRTPKAA